MKAMVFSLTAGGLEKNLHLDTARPLPKNAQALTQGSTLVKIAYASLNPADYKLVELALFRMLMMTMPAIPVMDYAGTVVTTTSPNLKVGERVYGLCDGATFGMLAEYGVISKEVVPLPDNVSLRDASTVGVAAITAYQCLQPCVKEGSKVLINGGSGGTGTFGIQIAKALGCIVATTCSTGNVELCKDLGADTVIDYRSADIVEQLKRQGTQYDLIIDNVGTPALYFSSHHYLKEEGRFISIAGAITLSSVVSMLQMFFLPSWLGGGTRKMMFLGRKSNVEDYKQVAAWMSEGKVKAVVEKEFALEDSAAAFERLKSGRVRGKLVIKVGEEGEV
jgi:NADPH:quinone reductase-like Zn-dependent oxidoreductase